MDENKKLLYLYEFANKLTEGKHIGTKKGVSRRDVALRAISKDDFKSLKSTSSSSALRKFNSLVNEFKTDFLKYVNEYRSEQEAAEREKRDMVYGKGHLYDRLKSLLRSAYYNAYRLGIEYTGIHKAGVPTLSQSDIDWLESAIKSELRYLKKFVDHIHSREIDQPGRMKLERRIQMYIDSLNSIFDAGKVSSHPPLTIFYWVHSADKKVCPECLLLGRFSPYTRDTLPTTPRSGASRCLSNCRCKLYSKIVSETEYQKVHSINYSKKYFLDLLRKSRNNQLPKYYYES